MACNPPANPIQEMPARPSYVQVSNLSGSDYVTLVNEAKPTLQSSFGRRLPVAWAQEICCRPHEHTAAS